MSDTRIYLVRHGATQATDEDRFSGSTDAELSEEGRWQAARLGERLAPQGITARLFQSALARAGHRAHRRRPLSGRSGHARRPA